MTTALYTRIHAQEMLSSCIINPAIPTEKLKEPLKAILKVVQKIFNNIATICSDPKPFTAILKKLDLQVFPFVEHIANRPNYFTPLRDIIKSSLRIFEFLQVGDGLDYIVNKRFKIDRMSVIPAKTAKHISNFVRCGWWLADVNFINRKNLSLMTSKITFLKHCNKASVLRVSIYISMVSLAFFAIDALLSLLKDGNCNYKFSAAIGLANYGGEFILSTMVVAGVTNVIALGIVGSVCIGLNIGCHLYQDYR